jgi:hypothetical protein
MNGFSTFYLVCTYVIIQFVSAVRASYVLPGLQSLAQLEASNPEVRNLSNINSAAAGFCLENSVTNYVHYYSQLNPDNPFQHCNGDGKYQFENINMTLMARINLISLTTQGFEAFSNDSGFSEQCQAEFPDYCYFVMWYFNVQAGFRCLNPANLPSGAPILPPCRFVCRTVLSCPLYKSAIKRQGETDLMLCEYFPAAVNCHSSDSASWIPKFWMISLAVFPALLYFLVFQ